MSSSLTERDDDGRDSVVMDGVDEDVPELPDPGLPAESEEHQDNREDGQGHGSDNDDDDDARTIRGDDAADRDPSREAVIDGAPGGDNSDSVYNGERGRTSSGEGHIAEILAEEREQSPATPVPIGNGSVTRNRYRDLVDEDQQQDSASEDGSALGLPQRPGSPTGSTSSVAESTASNQRSVVSSLGGSSIFRSSSSGRLARSASPSFRPFDQRFQSRISSPSSSSLLSPRPSSPALLALHNRSSSLSTLSGQLQQLELSGPGTESPSPPWEVVRWTKLTKLSSAAFSESAKRNFGSPTCMAISASIVLGTTKGILLVFDYNQNLKMIIGPGTRAVEAGAITAVAISADHTTVAGGHADGSIFTWEMSRAARPFLHIPPLDAAQAQNPQRTVDGHIRNFTVTNLGFLGTRRTALVSADDRGMAFAHLATRGTGALGRTVKTNRILGRYPGSKPPTSGKAIKPSTVLAFAPLPWGNVDRATDTMGLTAMLTPYLLVIVSTTPVANTQHKSPRPKEVAPHSAMSGCLAWFPAVKLNLPDPRTGDSISKAKLVYCWSNVLTVLDVDEIPSEDKDKPPSLHCKARSRWKCEEAIVAVQWLTRSVLAVLTISQRLIVLEDHSMRVTEAFDLINRYIYHADLFSRQLQGVVEILDEEDTSLHGVVADAFFMSFKTYKGRLFLLGFNDMAIGALSNWADRLIALMEHGDYVGAIQLANSFYTGDADKLTIGLPEDTATRHGMVRERLMEIMAASLKYAFGQRQRNRAAADDDHLLQLAQTCFAACESVGDTDFLFDEMYEWFEEAGVEGIFLETLEPYILDKIVTAVPPTVVKALVRHYVGRGMESRLEEMICHMDTATLDLDQITTLCKQHSLYDALIYVWNQAMTDFITPLIDLLSLLVPHMPNGEYEPPENATGEQDMHDTNALKMFPYLSYVLTGRIYPTGEPMNEAAQQEAKSEIYWFLFSGKSVVWPRGSSMSRQFLTRPNQSQEPSFPYLRMILKFHAPSFLSALNEAFEDPFLNDSPEKQLVNGSTTRDLPEEQVFGLTVDRQYIVSILTEIMNPADFAPEDTIYLDMFIARNLPKYPQYLLIPESTLTKVLTGLCHYPGSDLEEDAQLSAEYLLSVYHPPDMAELIPLFKEAGFYRILKRTYRADKQYGKLLQTYFEDPDDQHGVFDSIAECLRAQPEGDDSASSKQLRRQIQEAHNVIKEHALDLVELDAAETARKLDEFAPELHQHILKAAEARHDLQYVYLKTILEDTDATADEAAAPSKREARPGAAGSRRYRQKQGREQASASADDRRDLIEQYVRLMCEFDPSHVSDYVGLVQSVNLRLDELLPTMEETGVVDAAVVLMAHEGQVQEAMDRLVQHLHTLESAVQGLLVNKTKSATVSNGSTSREIEASDRDDDDARSDSAASNVTIVQHNAAEDLMRALQKYTHVGIWLCQSQTNTLAKSRQKSSVQLQQRQQKKAASSGSSGSKPEDESDLLPDEKLWLQLINATVQITRNLSLHLVHETSPAGSEEGAVVSNGVTSSAKTPSQQIPPKTAEADKLVDLLRSLVQHTFTALLTTTTSSQGSVSSPVSSSSRSPSNAGSGNAGRSNGGVTGTNNLSFLRILKAFLARAAAASPSLADLRAVLQSIFAAYAYEEVILRLAGRLLERSLFVSVQRAVALRQRGWRAKGSTCEACGRRVWGPGVQQQATAVGGSIYEAWEQKQAIETQRRNDKQRAALMASRGGLDRGKGKDNGEAGGGVSSSSTAGTVGDAGKGKGRQQQPPQPSPRVLSPRPPGPERHEGGGGDGERRHAIDPADNDNDGANTGALQRSNALQRPQGQGQQQPAPAALGPLVVFACRHIYHQSCLDALEAAGSGEAAVHKRQRQHGERERDYVCPIDG